MNNSLEVIFQTHETAVNTAVLNSKLAEKSVGFYRGIFSPIIALLGIFGNFIVLIVFSREKQRSRFSIYCIVLSVIHIVILLTNSLFDDFLGRGLEYLTDSANSSIKLDIKSNWHCKIMEYLPNAAYFASSWVMIIFSCDRIVTIFHPLKYLSINYQISSWLFSICAIVISLLLNSSLLVIYQIQIDSKHGFSDLHLKCDISKLYSPKDFIFNFSLYMKVIGAFVLPNFIVIGLNFVICTKLYMIQRTRTKLLPLDSKNNSLEMNRVIGHLALSSCFILLTMPLVIVMILRMHAERNNYRKIYPIYLNVIKHLSRLFSSIKDINYASDFLLYFIFLPNFRWRFLRLACLPCREKLWFKNSRWGQLFEHNFQRFDSSVSRRKLIVASGHYNTEVGVSIPLRMKHSLSLTPNLDKHNRKQLSVV